MTEFNPYRQIHDLEEQLGRVQHYGDAMAGEAKAASLRIVELEGALETLQDALRKSAETITAVVIENHNLRRQFRAVCTEMEAALDFETSVLTPGTRKGG